MANGISTEVIGKLRAKAVALEQSVEYRKIVQPRDEVLARFQPMFAVDRISTISADDFKSFLLFNNNRHWTGLQRQSSRMCADMTKLRRGLSTLIDEDQPLAERLDRAMGDVYGMGKTLRPRSCL